MTVGILLVIVWFAGVAGYLVWQFATNALLSDNDSLVGSAVIERHPAPAAEPAWPVVQTTTRQRHIVTAG